MYQVSSLWYPWRYITNEEAAYTCCLTEKFKIGFRWLNFCCKCMCQTKEGEVRIWAKPPLGLWGRCLKPPWSASGVWLASSIKILFSSQRGWWCLTRQALRLLISLSLLSFLLTCPQHLLFLPFISFYPQLQSACLWVGILNYVVAQTMCGAWVAPKHLYNDACVGVDIIESC